MNVLNAIRIYPGSWAVKESRAFTQEELDGVKDAVVVDSQYGMSVCLTLTSGGKGFIPVSNTCSLALGDQVDLAKAKLLTLCREGEADIYRIEA